MQGPSIQPGWLQSVTVASNDSADDIVTTVDPAALDDEISALATKCDSLDLSGDNAGLGWDIGVDQAQRERLNTLKKQQAAAATAQKRLKRIESDLNEQNAVSTDVGDNENNDDMWANSKVLFILPFSFDFH